MAGLIWLWQRGQDTGGSGKRPPTRNAYRPKKPRMPETMRMVIFAYGYGMATER
jgi:hypothetical protein